eukprot:718012-Lingulodinium_polyedra.AAC.1
MCVDLVLASPSGLEPDAQAEHPCPWELGEYGLWQACPSGRLPATARSVAHSFFTCILGCNLRL